MSINERVEEFYKDLFQELIDIPDNTDDYELLQDTYTGILCDYLVDSGEIFDYTVCRHKDRAGQCNAYNIPEDETSIDIFVTIFNKSEEIVTTPKSKIEDAYKKAILFVNSAIQ